VTTVAHQNMAALDSLVSAINAKAPHRRLSDQQVKDMLMGRYAAGPGHIKRGDYTVAMVPESHVPASLQFGVWTVDVVAPKTGSLQTMAGIQQELYNLVRWPAINVLADQLVAELSAPVVITTGLCRQGYTKVKNADGTTTCVPPVIDTRLCPVGHHKFANKDGSVMCVSQADIDALATKTPDLAPLYLVKLPAINKLPASSEPQQIPVKPSGSPFRIPGLTPSAQPSQSSGMSASTQWWLIGGLAAAGAAGLWWASQRKKGTSR
jgi:hypothetical protein